jgi:hypothetical protein
VPAPVPVDAGPGFLFLYAFLGQSQAGRKKRTDPERERHARRQWRPSPPKKRSKLPGKSTTSRLFCIADAQISAGSDEGGGADQPGDAKKRAEVPSAGVLSGECPFPRKNRARDSRAVSARPAGKIFQHGRDTDWLSELFYIAAQPGRTILKSLRRKHSVMTSKKIV